MKKELRKYLFTLCILLLNGYSFLNANPDQCQICYASTILKNPEYTESVLWKNSNFLTIRYTPTATKEKYKIYSEKEEEDSYEPFFARTYTLIGNYFAIFYKKISRCIFFDIKKRLFINAHWFYSSSHKNIILRVMRI